MASVMRLEKSIMKVDAKMLGVVLVSNLYAIKKDRSAYKERSCCKDIYLRLPIVRPLSSSEVKTLANSIP